MTRDEIVQAINSVVKRTDMPTSDPQISRTRIDSVNIAELADHLNLHFLRKDARIDELLQTNNDYLERARAAERLNDELKLSIAGCARLFGQLAALVKS